MSAAAFFDRARGFPDFVPRSEAPETPHQRRCNILQSLIRRRLHGVDCEMRVSRGCLNL
jgi:hypothetical protein